MSTVYYSVDTPTRSAFKYGVRSRNRKSNNGYSRDSTTVSIPGGKATLSWALQPLGASDQLNNRLYDSAMSSLRGDDRPSSLTAIAEMRSSIDMIGNRSMQLYQSYRAIRSGKLEKALHILGSEPKRHSSFYKEGNFATVRGQRYSALWLEYWMGWAPSVNDINNAANVLSKPPPATQKVTAGARNMDQRRQVQGNPSNPTPGIGYSILESNRTVKRGFYSNATLTNENLFLAQSLGLVNPLLTVWEVTPFSWLVDWSANVGKFLGSFTDTLGASLTRSGYGTMSTSKARYSSVINYSDRPSVSKDANGTRESLSRSPQGIIRPTLTVQIPHLSLTRAATAVSLLSLSLDSHRDYVAGNKRKLQVF